MMKERLAIFAQRLRKARETQGLTQVQLAAKLNMTQAGYHFYECGEREPPLNRLTQISLVLGVRVPWLLGLE